MEISVKIEVLKLHELGEEAREKAIFEHQNFLNSMGIECDDENGNTVTEHHEHTEAETVDSIEANEYYFYSSGEIAQVVHYCGGHPRAGETILTHEGKEYNITELAEA